MHASDISSVEHNRNAALYKLENYLIIAATGIQTLSGSRPGVLSFSAQAQSNVCMLQYARIVQEQLCIPVKSTHSLTMTTKLLAQAAEGQAYSLA